MAGLVLLCALAFWPMFANGFVWDDLVFIRDNEVIRGFWPLARFLNAPPGLSQRPLMMFSFALDYHLFGLDPFGYHLANFLLHVLCVLGVVFLGQRLFGEKNAGLLAGALFAVHPGHAEAVISFLGRSDLLASAFLIWGLWAYLKSSSSQNWQRPVLFGAAIMSLALACLSKDTAVIFPGLVVLCDWAQGNLAKGRRRSTLWRWIPLIMVLLLYGVFRRVTAGDDGGQITWWGGSPWKTVLLAFVAYGEYIRLSMVPLTLSPWYEIEQLGAQGFRVGLGLALTLLTFAGLVLLVRRSLRGVFLVGWFALSLSPVLVGWLLVGLGSRAWGVLPGTMMAERWFYLPSMATCFAGAWGWSTLKVKMNGSARTAWIALLALILVLFGAYSLTWCTVWRNQKVLGQTILSRFPRSYLGHVVLGAGLIEDGRIQDGLTHYREAVSLRPDLIWIRYNFAVALRDLGRTKEAIEEYHAVLRIQPQNSSAHNNLGDLLYEQGKLPEAEAEFRETVRLDPDHVSAHVNLGNVLDELGRPGEAEAEYRKALRLDPEFAGAYYNLAIALLHQGKTQEAVQALESTLAQGGGNRDEVESLLRKLREP